VTPHLDVVARLGQPVQCPQCRMWFEPHTYAVKNRQILCWCDNWLDIFYVEYVIEELGVLR